MIILDTARIPNDLEKSKNKANQTKHNLLETLHYLSLYIHI